MPFTQAKNWSGPKRQAVLAVMMGVIFLSSVGLAYAWTLYQSRWAPAPPPPNAVSRQFRLTQIAGLQLGVPRNWLLVKTLGTTGPLMKTFDAKAVYIDPSSPTRALLLGSFHDNTQPTALDVLKDLLKETVPPPGSGTRQQGETVQYTNSGSIRITRLQGVYGTILSRLDRGNYRLHLVAVLTEDGQRFWVIYLSHVFAVQSLSTIHEVIVANNQLMTQILATAVRQPDGAHASASDDQPGRPGRLPVVGE